MIQQIKKCPLFAGIAEPDLNTLIACLSAKRRNYDRGEFVLLAGSPAESVGIVLSGRVHILKEDLWGNQVILSEVGAPGLFAEAFACTEETELPVSVLAAEATDVLLVDYRRIITSCSSACVFHAALIKNMLRVLAQKNRALVDKIEHVTKRTTQEKLLSYLSEQAKIKGSNSFEIPFNRQELADYLAVERSAMSAELSKMRDAGVLAYHKNRFEILKGIGK